MDVGWLSSQLVVAVVVLVLVVGGLAFFALVEPRRRDAGGDGAAGAGDGAGNGAGDGARVDQATERPGQGPDADGPAATSVFETEPCWLSLVPGRRTPDRGDAPIGLAGGPDGMARQG